MIGTTNTINEHLKALEKPIEVIAHVRRMAEIDGTDMEEFDAKLNALCAKKHEKFANMGEGELALYALKVIFDAGRGEELAKEIFGRDE